MWAVTFVPNNEGKDGVFSVVTLEQLTAEHSLAFSKRLMGADSPLCERAELVLYVSSSQSSASEVCTKMQNALRK